MEPSPVATRNQCAVHHVSISLSYSAAKESSLPATSPGLGPDPDHAAALLTRGCSFHSQGCAAQVRSLHHGACAPELVAEAPVRNLRHGACVPELVAGALVRNLRHGACAPELAAEAPVRTLRCGASVLGIVAAEMGRCRHSAYSGRAG